MKVILEKLEKTYGDRVEFVYINRNSKEANEVLAPMKLKGSRVLFYNSKGDLVKTGRGRGWKEKELIEVLESLE